MCSWCRPGVRLGASQRQTSGVFEAQQTVAKAAADTSTVCEADKGSAPRREVLLFTAVLDECGRWRQSLADSFALAVLRVLCPLAITDRPAALASASWRPGDWRASQAKMTSEPVRVAVVCGGNTVERGISINSARSLLECLGASGSGRELVRFSH